MIGRPARIRLDILRTRLATVVLLTGIVASVGVTSLPMQLRQPPYVILLPLLFSLLMAPEAFREVRALWKIPLFRYGVWSALILFVGWKLFIGQVWHLHRTWLYIAVLLLGLAAAGWLRQDPEHRWLKIAYTKIATVAAAITWICIDGFTVDRSALGALWKDLPVYFHVRHANMEVFTATALIVGIWKYSGATSRALFATALALFGYFSAWTGGRGEILSIAVFSVCLLTALNIRSLPMRWLAMPAAAFASGVLMAALSGHGHGIERWFARTMQDSVDEMSSGRLTIWTLCIERVSANWDTLWFGFGPDAYARAGMNHALEALTGRPNFTAQPHNTLVLWLLEFGVVGTVPLAAWSLHWLTCATQTLKETRATPQDAAIAGLLIATYFYSLFDGQFYYDFQLCIIALAIAYLGQIRRRISSTAGNTG